MNGCDCEKCNVLVKKVEQHEETITQLIGIIAATNRRISDLADKQIKKEQMYSS